MLPGAFSHHTAMNNKWKKFGFISKMLMFGLCNFSAGIFFGAGCLFAEHIDSNWVQSDEREESSTELSRSSPRRSNVKSPR
jgi:hypothetical protein